MLKQRIYSWIAFDRSLQAVRGDSAAHSIHQLRFQLFEQGLTAVKVTSVVKPSRRDWQLPALIVVTRQLAMLLQAGLPLLDCLKMMAEEQPKPQWRYLINQIQRQVAEGVAFSQALAQYPQVFPPIFCELIKTAELTGDMALCCSKLLEQQEKSLALRQRVKKALRYPLFVLAVTLAVALLMLTVVLPEFAEIYRTFETPLPLFTQWVMATADMIKDYGIIAAVALVIIAGGYLHYFHSSPEWRRREQALMMSLPLMNTLLRAHCSASIFYSLSMTLRAGIVLSEGLGAAANAIGYDTYRRALFNIQNRIEQGEPFYSAVAECGLFSELSRRLIQMGETSGSLETILAKLAEIHENELNQITDNISQTLEPLLMTVLAGIVGSLVIAMYLPIFQLGNAIT
jgi:protein transport protein HofC